MRTSTGIAVAVCAFSLACTGATAESGTSRVTAVMTVQGAMVQLAVNAGRVAWIDPIWRLHVVRPGSSRPTTVVYTEKRLVNVSDPFATWPQLAFAGSHPIWVDARGKPRTLESVFTTDRRGRLRAMVRLSHYDSGAGGPGDYVLSVAGDPAGGVYSWTHVSSGPSFGGQNTGGGIWTVGDAISHRIPGLRPAIAIARSGSRLALVPVRTTQDDIPLPESDDVDPIVQIATVGGRIVATYHTRYEAEAVAITTRFVFVEESRAGVDPIKGGTAILSASTGKLLHWLPGKGAGNMSASGRYAVFSNYSKVYLLDGATGRITRIAVVPSATSTVINAVLDGKMIWWAVAKRAPGRKGDVFDPADFTTTMYRRAL